MIHEVLVTSLDQQGNLHIAPMGVHQDQGLWVIKPFKPSTTLTNILNTGTAVLNFCDDVRIFAGCLTGHREWPLNPTQSITGLYLADALSHCELRLNRVEDDEIRPALYCQQVAEINHRPFRGFNRAQFAVIEAAILASRLDFLPTDKIDTELAYLQIGFEKTAGPHEREAWDWLMAKIAAVRSDRAIHG